MKVERILLFALAALVLLVALLLWQGRSGPDAPDPSASAPPLSGDAVGGRAALLPLPPPPALPAAKVALGERLFFDKRLSADDSIACASCHDFARGGTDRLPVSVGIGGKTGQINAPSVFNVALNFAQFWDGRAPSLEAQIAGPIHNPVEMGSSWAEVGAKLKADATYVAAFEKAYPGRAIDGETIADAIATYERTLLTESRFDRFLRGERDALSPLEQTGYRHFLDYGCVSCHQGVLLGGNLFQRFGVMQDYFAGRPVRQADLGRFNVTGREEDRHVFKVPSLRNVAVTAPYFHDASAATLAEAIIVMARVQLGRELPREDVVAIEAFLHSLTGVWQGRELQ